ncbi:hypothetical protein COW46_02945 [Candidatus Gracilibacteria bacterium CG17_big_fil_post_rev_8_21_14_2_50_48_13]|nr:MAG: hypothetical protein COW46_02945 [Candidatus Gracilibacteria bacterium CG17_big_fil_post_rev_8_21_14_2_50_48_13]
MAKNLFSFIPGFYSTFNSATKISDLGGPKVLFDYIAEHVMNEEYLPDKKKFGLVIDWAKEKGVSIDEKNLRNWTELLAKTYGFLVAGETHKHAYRHYWTPSNPAYNDFTGKGIRYCWERRVVQLPEGFKPTSPIHQSVQKTPSHPKQDSVETIPISVDALKKIEARLKESEATKEELQRILEVQGTLEEKLGEAQKTISDLTEEIKTNKVLLVTAETLLRDTEQSKDLNTESRALLSKEIQEKTESQVIHLMLSFPHIADALETRN